MSFLGKKSTAVLCPEVLDHRELNHDLDYFVIDEAIGAGLPLWLSRKVAEAWQGKVPVVVVVGDREAAGGPLGVQWRHGDKEQVSKRDLEFYLKARIERRQ